MDEKRRPALLPVLILVMLTLSAAVLTYLCISARQMQQQAEALTGAVIAADSISDAFLASEDIEQLAARFFGKTDANNLTVWYTKEWTVSESGHYCLQLVWEDTAAAAGTLSTARITVSGPAGEIHSITCQKYRSDGHGA